MARTVGIRATFWTEYGRVVQCSGVWNGTQQRSGYHLGVGICRDSQPKLELEQRLGERVNGTEVNLKDPSDHLHGLSLGPNSGTTRFLLVKRKLHGDGSVGNWVTRRVGQQSLKRYK